MISVFAAICLTLVVASFVGLVVLIVDQIVKRKITELQLWQKDLDHKKNLEANSTYEKKLQTQDDRANFNPADPWDGVR